MCVLKAGSNGIVKPSFYQSVIYVSHLLGHVSGEAISIILLILEVPQFFIFRNLRFVKP